MGGRELDQGLHRAMMPASRIDPEDPQDVFRPVQPDCTQRIAGGRVHMAPQSTTVLRRAVAVVLSQVPAVRAGFTTAVFRTNPVAFVALSRDRPDRCAVHRRDRRVRKPATAGPAGMKISLPCGSCKCLPLRYASDPIHLDYVSLVHYRAILKDRREAHRLCEALLRRLESG